MSDAIDSIIDASIAEKNINRVMDIAGFKAPPLSHDAFCLAFSERVMCRYLANEYTFNQADLAINWLFAHSYVSENCPGEMPTFAREVFEAFDEGEYYHPGDSPDDDPELKYTRPQLQRLFEDWQRRHTT